MRGAARHLPDIQLRFATLLGRLGPALDGPGSLADADAWYFILEGTREPSVAEAQAMAITELAARAVTDTVAEPRAMLLAADDYSAVSRRVPLSNLYERGRSLGIGVQVSAQTWQGLGATEDERYRIAATADGGIWVMSTPYPEPLAALAGQRRVLQTAHELVGATWGDRGTTHQARAWTADPDLIRRLRVGQACYIHRGAATFVQVARPKASPLSLLPARVPVDLPAPRREAAPAASGAEPIPANLDDVLGPGADGREPVRRARPAGPSRPDRRAGPRRLAQNRRRHPPRPARRRRRRPLHRSDRRLRRAAHALGPQRGLRRPGPGRHLSPAGRRWRRPGARRRRPGQFGRRTCSPPLGSCPPGSATVARAACSSAPPPLPCCPWACCT